MAATQFSVFLAFNTVFSRVFDQKVGGAQVDANCTAGLVL